MASARQTESPDLHPGRWWHSEGDRFRCDLCPRACLLSPGQRGFCFVRVATDAGIALATYGRSSGFCVDPVEKKPLSHFLPGSAVLSLGTAGCNLGCRYCQNWDISTAKSYERLADRASPEQIAQAAVDLGCASVAFTYNDPIVFAEYAIDAATACRERGIRTIAVTNGYICAEARTELFATMDAVNIDLKAMTEGFYRKRCLAHLAPVLESIEYVANETDCWLELTTLLIPGVNDSNAELHALATWVRESVGPDVPLHLSAFTPQYKMMDIPPTRRGDLLRAWRIALDSGLHYVYVGNLVDAEAQSTYCPTCGSPVIVRVGYEIREYNLGRQGNCCSCGRTIAGYFAEKPGHWGNRRVPVRLAPPVTGPESPRGAG